MKTIQTSILILLVALLLGACSSSSRDDEEDKTDVKEGETQQETQQSGDDENESPPDNAGGEQPGGEQNQQDEVPARPPQSSAPLFSPPSETNSRQQIPQSLEDRVREMDALITRMNSLVRTSPAPPISSMLPGLMSEPELQSAYATERNRFDDGYEQFLEAVNKLLVDGQ